MKHISKFIMGAVVLGSLSLTACNDAEYSELKNQAYILQTSTNPNSSTKLTVGNEAVSTTINVRLSDKATTSTTYRLVYDEAALEAYNERNETSYAALPQGAFTMSSDEATVEAGTSVSTPVNVTILPYSDELKATGKKYALAFRLEGKDGNSAPILKSGSVMVFVLDQVVIQPVVVLNNTNIIKHTLVNPTDLNEWTFELNINKQILGTAVGQYNNQAFFWSGPDEIYCRFGDAPIEGNRLQIKTQGTQMNSQMLFNTNTWYHIAFVCTGSKLYLYVNGQLDNSMDMPGKTTRTEEFEICNNSSYTRGDAYFSEVRFWTKARSQAEIANNMYACDPTTPGLLWYYKLNEGSGNHFRDWTGNGNDTDGTGSTAQWIQDVRIDGK